MSNFSLRLVSKYEAHKAKTFSPSRFYRNWNLIALERTAAAVYVSSVQGRVQVTIGKEDHKFTEGSFTTFGEQMLEQVIHEKNVIPNSRWKCHLPGLSVGRLVHSLLVSQSAIFSKKGGKLHFHAPIGALVPF